MDGAWHDECTFPASHADSGNDNSHFMTGHLRVDPSMSVRAIVGVPPGRHSGTLGICTSSQAGPCLLSIEKMFVPSVSAHGSAGQLTKQASRHRIRSSHRPPCYLERVVGFEGHGTPLREHLCDGQELMVACDATMPCTSPRCASFHSGSGTGSSILPRDKRGVWRHQEVGDASSSIASRKWADMAVSLVGHFAPTIWHPKCNGIWTFCHSVGSMPSTRIP
jgi:hypothetical protein